MAELCVQLVPLFNALPIDEQMQIEGHENVIQVLKTGDYAGEN